MTTSLAHAVALREAGQLDEARDLLLELVRAHPNNPQINYQCAWAHDALGLEREAVPFYKRAIALGLADEARQGALLGLGSTLRTLGTYPESVAVLRQAVEEFPQFRAAQVFLAMTLYNIGKHHEAMSLLLRNLGETSGDASVAHYQRAIVFYADDLDTTWS